MPVRTSLSRTLRRFPLGVALLFPLALTLTARDAEPVDRRTSVDDEDAVSIRGIFDFQLPKIVWPKSLRVTVNPSWRDIISKDYIRTRVGLRYAFNDHLEVNTEALTHVDNFGGDGTGGFGVAEYRLGGKYHWEGMLKPYVDTALGFTVAWPGPGAPDRLHIGTIRYAPYVVFSRELSRVRGLNAFLNLGYEAFDSNPGPDRIAEYRPQRDNFSITPGVVIHRAPWHYTLAASVRSTAPSGEGKEYYSVLPSVSWEIPRRYQFRTPGRWIAGLGYEAIFYDDDIKHRVSGRLKWEFDWGKVVREKLPFIGGGSSDKAGKP